jgi:ParB family chromosome partitioning protein
MSTLQMKPLSWFKLDPNQPRKHFNEADLRHLGESLKVKHLQPVLCQPDGTIIAGERRYRAAMLVGLETLEVKIADEQLSDSQRRLWQLTENIQRKNLTGYEMWMGCAELMCMNPGWEMKSLAEALKLDPSSVTRILSPSRCTAAWQEALKDGRVGISDCYAASKLPEKDQAEMLALKRSGASRDAIEQAGRKKRTGNTPTVKVSRLKVPLPSGVTVQISGLAITLDDAIEATQDALKAMKKAREEGLDSKTAQAVFRGKSEKSRGAR